MATSPVAKSDDKSKFFKHYYEVSDDPNALEEWVNLYTDDATVIMGPVPSIGTKNVTQLRQKILDGFRTAFKSMDHKCDNVYYLSGDLNEVMLHGRIDYFLLNGKELIDVPWAVKARFRVVDDKLRMSYYEVFMNMTLVQEAFKV
ncbi:hypothetical protein CALVIDRAFT_32020 [Calocera viscosa TUFC12733]|uniref:SnoaL-like domain-containing protein n=1 Tax=Calocera viscosa (strain TUFC12733) TaxID=1330018 RepID=A0A167FSB7_CALVF|nr:hypothetical protein CALVIDRAFT_32020 [Calocera viscosa TUFC12733]